MVEAIETVSAKDGGKLQQLSVQQVIDCSYENKGCSGGSPVRTLDWLAQVLSSAFSFSHDDITNNWNKILQYYYFYCNFDE